MSVGEGVIGPKGWGGGSPQVPPNGQGTRCGWYKGAWTSMHEENDMARYTRHLLADRWGALRGGTPRASAARYPLRDASLPEVQRLRLLLYYGVALGAKRATERVLKL